jgi:hypothetical protein
MSALRHSSLRRREARPDRSLCDTGPKAAITDFEGLWQKASELAQKYSSMFWWASRDKETAFCFQKHGAAFFFQIYCINSHIPNRPEW